MVHKRRRSSKREQFWREAVGAWKKSGQSVRAFCAERGLREPSFYAWRRTLREREPGRRPVLVPLRVVGEAILEVVLPTGLVVRVPVSADAVATAKLVAALGSASC